MMYALPVVLTFFISGSAFAACNNLNIGPEDFCGKYRANLKTSFYKTANSQLAPFEHYDGLAELLSSLPSDQEMRAAYRWGINTAPAFRVDEKAHNVEVTAYIVAVDPTESDRDLHVIVSNRRSGPGRVFMNVEVSGLPTIDRADFERARAEIRAILPEVDSEHKDYISVNPTKILIRGSLFFDGDHGAGCSHCSDPSFAKPRTIWEIHPVYSITAAQ